MNKIFRVIWSHAQQTWVAVSELTKSQGKSHSTVNEQAVEIGQNSAIKWFSLSTLAVGVLLATDPAFAVRYYQHNTTANGSDGSTVNGSTTHATSVVLGRGATAVDNVVNGTPDLVVIGGNAKTITGPGGANGSKSVVVGYNAQATESSVAVGWNTQATHVLAVSVGREAVAYGESGVSVGHKARSGYKSIALGLDSEAVRWGFAAGDRAKSHSNGGIALGVNAVVGTAGQNADTAAVYGVAIGQNAHVTGTSGVAIGQDAKANQGNFGNAFGASSQALGRSSFAVGHTAIAKGATSVAILFESKADKDNDIAIGHKAQASGGSSLALMENTTASGHRAIAIGSFADSTEDSTIAIGHGAKATESSAMALMKAAKASGLYSLAIGQTAEATETSTIAIGHNAVAKGDGSISIGDGSETLARGASSFGAGAIAEAEMALALGVNSNASTARSVALGDEATTAAAVATNTATVNGVTYSGFAGNTAVGTVSVGKTNEYRQIHNVAAGRINSGSTDAINGSQLYVVAKDLRTYIDSRPAGTGGSADNYFHINPETTVATAAGTNNKAAVDAVGQATGARSLAAGFNAASTGNHSVAIGNNANSSTANATVVGSGAVSGSQSGSVVIGANAKGHAGFTGGQAGLSQHNNYNNKYNSLTNNTAGFVQKNGANVQSSVVAVGKDAVAQGGGVAIGDGAQSLRLSGALGVAIGANAVGKSGGIAIGSSTIAEGQNSFALGRQAAAVGAASQAIGSASAAVGKGSTAIGHSAQAIGERSIAFGSSTSSQVFNEASATIVKSDNAIGIGSNARIGTNAASGIAMGQNATIADNAEKSIAIGVDATVSGDQSIAIGVGNQVSGNNAGAFGDPNTVSGNNSYAFGNDNTVSTENTFVLGNNVTTTVANSVILGNKSGTVVSGASTKAMDNYATDTVAGQTLNFAGGKPTGLVSVGSATETRRIQGVSAGLISATSTDAINGSQLYAVADGLKTYIDSRPTGTGTGTAPNNYFHVNNGTNANTGDATTNLGKVTDAAGAQGLNSVTAGIKATTKANDSVAIGHNVTTAKQQSIAVGNNARTLDQNSIAIGTNSKTGATGVSQIAIGMDATVDGGLSIAIGQTALSQSTAAVSGTRQYSTVAVGSWARATGDISTAIGTGADALSTQATSVGHNATVGLNSNTSTAIGSYSRVNGNESVALGAWNNVTTGSNGSTAFGFANTVTGDNSIVGGFRSNVLAGNAIGLGNQVKVNATHAVAIGGGANVTASGTESVVLGVNTRSQGHSGVAIGSNARIDADVKNAVAIGREANATLENSVALGAGSTTQAVATKENSAIIGGVTYGDFKGDENITDGDLVSVGSAGNERQIKHVAPGKISADSTDAINGSQLYAVASKSLSNFTTSVNGAKVETINQANNDVNFVNGKGTTARNAGNGNITFDVNTTTIAVNDTTGAVTVPTTEDNSIATAKTVADAIAKSGFTVKANDETSGKLINPGDSVTFKQGQNIEITRDGANFTVKTADKVSFSNVTTTNLTVNNGGTVNMGDNKITNVANGTVNSTSKDAVNGSQLYAVQEIATSGWNIAANGNNQTNVGPKENVSLNNVDGNIIITKTTADNNVTFALNNNLTVGGPGKDGKPGKDGTLGVKGADGKNGVTLNGKDGTIGINGKDGTNATLTFAQGKPGLNGNDGQNGESKTRIVYEKPNGETEQVATLTDGLRFTGNNGVLNNHTLNSLVTIVGEGVSKEKSEAFTSAAGNINVKADGKGNLTIQLAKDVNLTKDGSLTIGNTSLTNNGLNITNGPTFTTNKVDVAGNKITNVANGTVNSTSKDAVNGSQLYAVQEIATSGWNIAANGNNQTNVGPKENVSLNNVDGNIIITKTTADNNVTFALNNNLTVGGPGKDGKPGKDGTLGVKGADGKNGVTLNGKDGTIGINGKDGTNATLTFAQGKPGLNGNDGKNGETKTRIVYEKPNGQTEQVATLTDGLRFTGNNGVLNNHTLNSLVTIVGEGVSKAQSEAFTSAAGNINVKADGKGNLTIQLAKDVNLTKDGSLTIGNTSLTNNGLNITNGPTFTTNKVDVADNKITNVANGTVSSTSKDAVNGSQLYAVQEIATSGWNIAANGNNQTNVGPKENVSLNNVDGNIIITKTDADNNVTFALNNNLTIGGKDGKDGQIGVNGKDGKTGVTLNGKDGTIGINGKDGTNATLTFAQGKPGLNGNDGKDGLTKTRIEYTKPNGETEQVATLTDGLRFTGNNGVLNNHTLNSLVTIVGEGVDKEASEAFTSAAGNINVKADGKGNLTIQLAKDVNLTKDGSLTIGNTSLTNNGLNITNGPTFTTDKVDVAGNKITNVANGTVSSTSKDAVNGSQLYAVQEIATSGWNIAANGNNQTNVGPKENVSLNNVDGNIIITKTTADNNVTFALNNNLTVGGPGKDGKPGKDGTLGVKGADGKNGVTLNGKDGTIGINGKDGTNATLTFAQGKPGLNGNDGKNGETKTRIVYEKPNGQTEQVATLTDGLRFTGNNGVLNNHTLNSLVTIVGEGVSKAQSEAFTSAAGNINVKADGKGNLTIQLAKDVNLTKDGSLTIGNTSLTNNGLNITNGPTFTTNKVDVADNKITNVANGTVSSTSKDAVNGSQLYAVQEIATSGWNIAANGNNQTNVGPKENVSLNNVDGNIIITKTDADNNVTFALNNNLTIGGKDGKDGQIGVNGKDGKTGVTLNGKDGTIGINGKDGTNATLTFAQGKPGLNGNDGKDGLTKTRIEYTKPNGETEQVATLTDGLRFTGNNGVLNNHTLNSLVTIVGEGVDKEASEAFTSAAGNINVKADGKGNLTIQLAKDVNLTKDGSLTIGNTSLTNNGLNITNGPTFTTDKVDVAGNKITNVANGTVSSTSKDAVNGSQLYAVQEIATSGWNIAANGNNQTNVGPKENVSLNNVDGNIIITKTTADNNVTFALNNNLTVGGPGADGKPGKDGTLGVKGADGKNGVTLNGKDGSIGINGKDGTNATLTFAQGKPGLNGNDGKNGETKTRIVYEKPNGQTEQVATLTDGLRFTGNNGVLNNHTLNSLVTIVGEGVDKEASEAFTSAAGNINVKADGKGNLTIQLAKDVNLTKDGSLTIGNTSLTNNGLNITNGPTFTTDKVDVAGNKITNVANGTVSSTSKDAVNGSQLYAVQEIATSGWNIAANGNNQTNVGPKENVSLNNVDGNIIITKTDADNNVTFALNNNLTIGGKDGKDGQIGVNGKDGKTGVTLNGKDGSIGINGKDGTNATLTFAQGKPGLNGNDGKDGLTKTRIEYTKPNGETEQVATLTDGLRFTGNNGVLNNHTLNSLVTIVGEGVSKEKSEAFTSAAGNINVKADGKGNLTIQLAKDVNLTKDGSLTIGNTSLTNNGLNITNGPTFTTNKVDVAGNKITNVANGTVNSTSKDAVNGSQLYAVQEIATSGWNIAANGNNQTNVGPKENVSLNNVDGNIIITKTTADNNVTFALNNNLTVGGPGKDGKPGKDGTLGVKGADGKNGVTLNGKDGTIGINGKDGTNATLTFAQGKPGLNGNDGKNGETKTRIVYEKPNGQTEQVATLTDGLRFTGNNGVLNNHTLNSLVTIVGEGVSKAQSEAFTSAAGNINVKADGKGNLTIQLAKDVNLTKDGSLTIGNTSLTNNGLNITNGPTFTTNKVDVADNKITNVANGTVNSTSKDAVNGSQLYAVQEIATSGWNIAANGNNQTNVGPKENVSLNNVDGNIIITKTTADNNVTFALNNNLTVGGPGKDGKPGKDGTLGVKGADGKNGVTLNGKDGTIGINGKDGTNATLTFAQGKPGLNGNDGQNGESKTRIVYEKPNGETEQVATLTDGLRFTGNNGVLNNHTLNSLVTIVGEGVSKEKSEAFTSAAGNINVKADGKGNLTIQLAKDVNLTKDGSLTIGNTSLTNNGLNITNGPTFTTNKVDVAGNKITNVANGTVNSTSKDAVNGSQLYAVQEIATSGWNIAANGNNQTNVGPKENVSLNNVDGNIIITKTTADNNVTFALNNNLTVGGPGKDGKPGKDGTLGVKGADGKNGVTLNGKDGTIGINGKDGTNATLTFAQGKPGLNGNDGKNGETKTRIVYEKPNGQTEQVATLTDGLRFTGNNGVLNNHTLNSLVTIVGEGVSKAQSEAFTSAAGNINVKADGKGNLTIQLAKDVNLTKDGSLTIGNTSLTNNGLNITNGPTFTTNKVDVADNKITNVANGTVNSTSKDAVNGSQLYAVQEIATSGWNIAANGNNQTNVGPKENVSLNNVDGNIIITKTTADNNVTFALNNNLTVGGPGKDGKPGKDGTLGVKGADGKNGVTLNGKDGTIGINGKDGTNATLTFAQGKPGLNGNDGQNGESKTRIVYEKPNGETEQVATLTDGLRFTGNNGVLNNHTLNSLVTIVGEGVSKEKSEAFTSAAGNINVKADGKGNLTIQLAKDVNLTKDGSLTIGNTSLTNNGLNITNGPTFTTNKVDVAGNKITNVANGTVNSTSKDAVNGSQLYAVQEIATSGWNIAANGNNQTNVGPKENVSLNNVDGNIIITKTTADNNVTFALNNNLTVGGPGKDGKPGKDGTLGVKGADGKNGVTLNGKDGTIGINGKDGTNATLTFAQGKPGLNGNDGKNGETKTRIVYEKPNGQTEQVATLTDGLRFTGNNGVLNNHTLNSLVTIVGEGVSKAQSEAFTSAAGNINVKADGKGNLTIQLAKDVNLTKDGSLTIGNTSLTNNGLNITNGPTFTTNKVDVADNKITNVANGTVSSTSKDAVNGSQLYAVQEIATSGWNIAANGNNQTNVGPKENVSLNNVDGNIIITKTTADNNVTFALNNNLTVGGPGKDGKPGKDGTLGVKGADGKNGVTLNGKDGTIGINGKDGTNATLTFAQGKPGLNGNDGQNGESKTRIVYEKPNGETEQVATLTDGLRFTGNNGVLNNHTLNSLVTIVGEGVSKEKSEAFTSAAGNINVKADGKGNLTIQLAKDVNLTKDGSLTIGNTSLTNNGLNITNGPTFTTNKVDVAGNKITNVANGTVNSTSKDAVNGSQLYAVQEIATSGWNIAANGNNQTNVGPKENVSLNNVDGNIIITKTTADNNVTFALNNNLTVGGPGKDGKPGKDGTLGVKGADGKNGVTLNGKDGTIGINGKDGTNATLTFAQGKPGLNGNDGKNGETKTRIVYEKPNGQTEQVATLTDGLRFTGNNGVLNNHTLNSLVTIVGEGVSKAQSEAFTSAAGNINVKADGKGNLTIQLAKDVNLTKDGSLTIGNTSLTNNGLNITNGPTFTTNKVDVADNKITNVANGTVSSTSKDAVNGSQLYAVQEIATSGWNIAANGNNQTNVGPKENVSLNNVDGNIIITKTDADNNVTFALNNNLTIGGKDGKDGQIGVNGKDGKTGVTLNGKDGTIGINGKDGTNATLTFAQGKPGLNGNDGKDGLTKTRIEYTKPNGETEQVATLTDGLRFTGNNGVLNNHTLNSLVTIVGEGVDKEASEAFTSAAGNINVKADGKGNLTIQLAKDVNLTKDGSLTIGNTSLTNNGLNITNGPTFTTDKVDVAGNKITNVANGTVSSTSKDAVNGSQLYAVQEIATSGWNIAANGNNQTNVGPKENVSLNNVDGNIIITKTTADNNVTFALNNNLTVGGPGADGKPGKDGTLGVKGADGKNGVTLNGKDGSIGINGKDGTNATLTFAQGKPGLNGNDGKNGETKTRIVYEKPNGQTEQVATLTDGLRFTGNNGVLNNHTLNSLVTIVGEGVSKAQSEAFTSAAGNINVKADGKGNLTIQLAKDVNLTKDGSLTIGNTSLTNNGLNITNGPTFTTNKVDVADNKITNVANGTVSSTSKDAVNGSQLYAVQEIATSGWNIAANGNNQTNVGPKENVSLNNVDGNIIITKTDADNNVTFALNNNLTIGGKDGKDGQIGVNGKDGKTGVTLNGKDGSIGINGKDGTNATLTFAQGKPGLNGNDGTNGETKTRIVYEKPNGQTEQVATLNDGLKFVGDDGKVVTKKLNETLDITGGANLSNLADNNIGVVNQDGKLVVKLAKDIDLTKDGSVTIGNTTVNNDGITIKDGPSVTQTGINAGDKKVTGVADGDISATSTDAVNGSQLYQVQQVANAGWNLTANGKDAGNVKPGATVDLNNKDGNILITKAGNNVTFGLNTDLTIGGKDGKDGSIGVKGADGKTGVTLNGKDGTIGINGKDGTNASLTFAQGDKGLEGNDGKDGLSKTRIVYTKPNGDTEQVATLTDGLRFTGNNEVENPHKLNTLVKVVGEGVDKAASDNFSSAEGNINVKANGSDTLEIQLANNITLTEKGSLTIGNTTVNNDGLTIEGGPSVTNTGINAGDKKITNVANGTISATSKDAVNGSQLYGAIQNAGWSLSVNDEQESERINNNGKVTVKAGKNIEVSRKGSTVEIATSKDPEFNTVKVGGTTLSSKVANDGVNELNVADSNGKPTRITNVAAGVKDTDAVNVSQLKGTVNNLNNKINRNQREARAGIAGAAAIAGLPEIHLSGKSMVAAAASTYKGENAIAVGYSRLSDNSKIKLKVSGSADTNGNMIGTIGVGYAW